MVWSFILLLTISLNLIYSSTGQAQLSLQPQPWPACRTFSVTEFSYLFRVNPIPERTPIGYERHYLASELGLMRNLSTKYAIGASNFIGIYRREGFELHGGLNARIRRWLSQKTSVDLSLGLLFWGYTNDAGQPALTFNLGFNVRDRLGLSTLVQSVHPRMDWYSDDVAFYTGVRTGSTAGLFSNIILGVAGIVYVVVLLTSLEN